MNRSRRVQRRRGAWQAPAASPLTPCTHAATHRSASASRWTVTRPSCRCVYFCVSRCVCVCVPNRQLAAYSIAHNTALHPPRPPNACPRTGRGLRGPRDRDHRRAQPHQCQAGPAPDAPVQRRRARQPGAGSPRGQAEALFGALASRMSVAAARNSTVPCATPAPPRRIPGPLAGCPVRPRAQPAAARGGHV